MKTRLALTIALLAATPAAAQVTPFHGPGSVHHGAAVANHHRYEMDRLRFQSDQRADFAAQQQLNTRLTLREIEAARRPVPVQPEDLRPLGTIAEEHARREAASARRETTVEGVTQIDGWLDRPRD